MPKLILQDKIPCPRCNANSQKRIEERGEENLVILHICPMCRYRRIIGFTNKTVMKYLKKEQKYTELLNSDKKINEKRKILAKLNRVRELRRKAELGLRSK